MDFANLGLSEHIVKAVNDAGYTTPTPVQLAAIPAALAGKDPACTPVGTRHPAASNSSLWQ